MRARLTASLGTVLLLVGFCFAFAQSPAPGPQVVGVPAQILRPMPGGMIAPQRRGVPKGIPGFYDPATGKFTPSGGLVPKQSSRGVAPNASAGASNNSELSINLDTDFTFDSTLKPQNTLNCTAQITYLVVSVLYYDFDGLDATYPTSVEFPPYLVNFTLESFPVGTGAINVTATMSCRAEDDNGGMHEGFDKRNFTGIPGQYLDLHLYVLM